MSITGAIEETLHALANYEGFVLRTENTPQSVRRSTDWNRGFHAALGLAGEANEILQLFKKDLFGKNKSVDRADIVNEYGDLLWYFVLGLDALDITWTEVIDYNTQKLTARYAEKFAEATLKGAPTKPAKIQNILDRYSTWLPDEEQERLRKDLENAIP